MVGIEEPGNHLILWVPNFNQNANSFLSEATKGLGSHSVPWGLVQNPTGFMDRNAGALLFTWKIADCDGCSFPHSYEKILKKKNCKIWSFDLSPCQISSLIGKPPLELPGVPGSRRDGLLWDDEYLGDPRPSKTWKEKSDEWNLKTTKIVVKWLSHVVYIFLRGKHVWQSSWGHVQSICGA